MAATTANKSEAARALIVVRMPIIREAAVEIRGLPPGLLMSRIPDDWEHASKRTAEEAAEVALYRLNPEREGCEFGLPAGAFTKAMICAAGRHTTAKMTELRGVFSLRRGPDDLVPITAPEGWRIAHHMGRNANARGALIDLYRPLFPAWGSTLHFSYNAEQVDATTLLNLVALAGWMGVGAWRPEKGGEYGRFEVVGS